MAIGGKAPLRSLAQSPPHTGCVWRLAHDTGQTRRMDNRQAGETVGHSGETGNADSVPHPLIRTSSLDLEELRSLSLSFDSFTNTQDLSPSLCLGFARTFWDDDPWEDPRYHNLYDVNLRYHGIPHPAIFARDAQAVYLCYVGQVLREQLLTFEDHSRLWHASVEISAALTQCLRRQIGNRYIFNSFSDVKVRHPHSRPRPGPPRMTRVTDPSLTMERLQHITGKVFQPVISPIAIRKKHERERKAKRKELESGRKEARAAKRELELQAGGPIESVRDIFQGLHSRLAANPEADVLVSLCAMCVAMYDASSWRGMLAASYQFAAFLRLRFPDHGALLVEFLQIFMAEIANAAGSILCLQDDDEEGFGAKFWSLVNSPSSVLSAPVWDLLSCFSVGGPLTALGVFPSIESWKEFIATKLTPYLRKDVAADTVIERFLVLTKVFFENIKTFAKTGDLSALIRGSDHFQWLALTTRVMDDAAVKEPKDGGVITTGDAKKCKIFTPAERVQEMAALIEEGEAISKRMAKWDKGHAMLNTVLIQLARLRVKYEQWKARARDMGTRRAPFVVMIHGAPGIGKTEMIKRIHEHLMRRIEYPSSEKSIYVFRPGQKHFDGYTAVNTAVWFDDVDKFATRSNDGESWIQVFQNCANSLPYILPMADLHDKGAHSLRVPVIYFTTNHWNCNIAGLTHDPAAFWRRINLHVHLQLNPTHEKSPSEPVLDPSKMSGPFDPKPWTFNFSRYRKPDDPNTALVPHIGQYAVFTDANVAIYDIGSQFLAHHQREAQRIDRAESVAVCPACYLRHDAQGCPLTQLSLQAGEGEAAARSGEEATSRDASGESSTQGSQPDSVPDQQAQVVPSEQASAPPVSAPSSSSDLEDAAGRAYTPARWLAEQTIQRAFVDQWRWLAYTMSAAIVLPYSLYGAAFIFIAGMQTLLATTFVRVADQAIVQRDLRLLDRRDIPALIGSFLLVGLDCVRPIPGFNALVAIGSLCLGIAAHAGGPRTRALQRRVLIPFSAAQSCAVAAYCLVMVPGFSLLVLSPGLLGVVAFLQFPAFRRRPQLLFEILALGVRHPTAVYDYLWILWTIRGAPSGRLGELTDEMTDSLIQYTIGRLKHRFESRAKYFEMIVAVVTAMCLAWTAYRYYSGTRRKQVVRQADVQGDPEPHMNKGVRNNWAQPKPTHWSPVPLAPDPREAPSDASSTARFSDVADLAARNTGTIAVTVPGATRPAAAHFMRWRGSFIVCQRHLFLEEGEDFPPSADIEVMWGPGERSQYNWRGTVIHGTHMLPVPGRDLVVVYVPGIFPGGKGIDKFVASSSQFACQRQLDEAVLLEVDSALSHPVQVSTADYMSPPQHRRFWSYQGVQTRNRWCGYPLVVRRGPSAWIAGSHMASSMVDGSGVSEELIHFEIEGCVQQLLATKTVAVEAPVTDLGQGTGKPIVLQGLRDESMVNGTTHCSSFVIGTITHFDGAPWRRAKDRSRVHETSFAHLFRDDMLDATGGDPFVIPTFKGRVHEGQWYHPAIRRWKSLGTVASTGSADMAWAVADYLSGLELLPGRGTFRPLTHAETMAGVLGGSLGGFDRQTSVGYPFHKKKADLYPQGWEVPNPDVDRMIAWARAELDAGRPIVPVVSGSLKDESVKLSKEKIGKIRMFFAAPFYLNYLLKMYLGPLMAFMGMHKEFFECYVGMNLASSDCTDFVRHMTFFGGSRMIDLDIVECDSRVPPEVISEGVARVFVALATYVGYSKEDVERVRLLVNSLCHVVVQYKGDLFACSGHNWSGVLLTVVINVIFLAIKYRISWMCWLELNKKALAERALHHQVVFRNYVRLALLGDDTLMGVSPEIDGFDYKWLKEDLGRGGLEVKPGDKADGDYTYKTIFNVSFLKRRFIFVKELGHWCAQLERASILRSLVMRGHSKISTKDQESAILESAQLEFFLRGRTEFEAWSQRLRGAAVSSGLTPRFRTWEQLYSSFAARNFQVWAGVQDVDEE